MGALTATSSAPATQTGGDAAGEPRFEQLPNGLRLWLIPSRSGGRVSVQTWFASGSAHDPPGRPGFVERMRAALAEQIDAAPLSLAGATFESRTERDAIFFAWSGDAELLPAMLKAESRRLHAATATPALPSSGSWNDLEVEPELESLLFDLPTDAYRALLAAAFPNHPYGHAPAEPLLKPATAADAQEFFGDWLCAAQATLVIVGDVDPGAALALAGESFARSPSAPPPRRAPLPEPPPAQPDATASGPPRLLLAWRAPAAGRYELTALRVLMHRLCNPIDGPMCLQLLASGGQPPRWAVAAAKNHSLLVLSVAPEMTNAARLTSVGLDAWMRESEQAVLAALRDAENLAPEPVELRRARALAEAELEAANAHFHERSLRVGWGEMVAGTFRHAEFERLRVASLPVQALRDAARRLTRERPTVLRVLPAAASAPAAADRSPKRAAVLLDDSRLASWLADAELIRPGPRRDASAGRPVAPASRIIQAGRVSVQFGTCEPGQRARVTAESPLLLSEPPLAGVLLALGARTRAARFLDEYCSLHGIQASMVTGGIRLEGPPERLPQMTEILAELLAEPAQDNERIGKAFRDSQAHCTPRVAPVVLSPAVRADRLAAEWRTLLPLALGEDGLAARLAQPGSESDEGSQITLRVLADAWPDELPERIAQAWMDVVSHQAPPGVGGGADARADLARTAGRSNHVASKDGEIPLLWIPGGTRVELRAVVAAGPAVGDPTPAAAWAPALPQGVAPEGLLPPREGPWAWVVRAKTGEALVLGCSIDQSEVESRLALLNSLLAPRPPDAARDALLERLERLRQTADAAPSPGRASSERRSAATLRALLILGGDVSLAPVLETRGRLQRLRP